MPMSHVNWSDLSKQKVVIDFEIMLIGDVFTRLVEQKGGELMIP
jgi:hypothetical protein